MKSNTRVLKINDEIRREISKIINRDLKDPRLNSMITITKVLTTSDLKHSKVFVSVLGNDEDKSNSLKGLRAASGFIRKQIATVLNYKNTPEFTFVLDDSLEYGMNMLALIKKLNEV
jgi:ribosome-binding factor A